MPSASRVFDVATEGGYTITPQALAVAIRTAAIECRDDNGIVSLSRLYELTCDLENLKP